ncbi:hypothetical protein [Xanthocytophaga agilis]|uniref:Uncharacterized protein n=1 Tax=Xanthocytophaga agilis TaxID=3048010 RepID=A0AAE3UF35_9BACT|nr:hypothetical protein [Xanthocytophaga agilis]MDJ1501991.1 hypothetical protein [Xanthocytophaga agilis]
MGSIRNSCLINLSIRVWNQGDLPIAPTFYASNALLLVKSTLSHAFRTHESDFKAKSHSVLTARIF